MDPLILSLLIAKIILINTKNLFEAIEKAKLEARRKGYQVTEHKLPNGSVRLSIAVP